MAGNIYYLAPVDNASGKIFGKKQKFVAVRRNWGKKQRGCAVTGERTTPYTDDELAIQSSFATIAKAVALRMKNPDTLVQDQQAFRDHSQYKTFRQYLWAVVSAEQ